ncbi:hypothetical protein [Halocella sp. SP3-1]|uniref:hypothetical protein n=1 Tax=Halocella sp. SP3-1 TaxID=2382161 RepID=UPI000F7571DC|nr:hypothetical protein [Halocella sp. SP3-1]AZO95456.1 hypothetical protein D7D81_13110 [Halocella sp. SP3-1]
MNLWEKFLRSKKIRGIIRINLGFSLFRSHLFDINIPKGTSIYFFDYLLYKKTARKKSFKDFKKWLDARKLI